MSAAPLEQEFKFRLTAQEWKKLAALGRRKSVRAQTNHYFDVLPALPFARSGVGIRVRKQDAHFFFTVKMPVVGRQRGGKGLQVKREWETRLPPARAKSAVNGLTNVSTFQNLPGRALRKHASALPLAELRRIGQMKNLRVTVGFPDGLELELDKFSIGKKWLYEAECETNHPERDLKKIKALWKAAGIRLRPETQSKLKQFLAALK